jgi:hypothetical protein
MSSFKDFRKGTPPSPRRLSESDYGIFEGSGNSVVANALRTATSSGCTQREPQRARVGVVNKIIAGLERTDTGTTTKAQNAVIR